MGLIRIAVLFLLAGALSTPGDVGATAQVPDRIVVDGKEERLYTNPLSAYLQAHPGQLPEADYSSSANWRGYVAVWEVRDERLLLTSLEVEFKDPNGDPDELDTIARDVKGQLFPGMDPIVATWYSGALILPKGERVNYVHMGYGSTYERYTILNIAEGKVRERLDLDHKQFQAYRDAQFAAFKKTAEYREQYDALKARDDQDMDDEMLEQFLYEFESERYLSMEFDAAQP